jgi:Flp pilus assembly pilin Flp
LPRLADAPTGLGLLLQPLFFSTEDTNVRGLTGNAKHFLSQEDGVITIEYAFVAALIALVCFVVVQACGASVHALYVDICNQVTQAIGGGAAC